MKELNLLVTATSIVLCATAFAGEPTFGDPTIYGRLNLTIERARVEGADADTTFVDNGSRLGVRAGKSVGGETSAVIQVEGQLRHDPNGWIDFNGSIVKSRDTWVGLQDGKLGAVRFGMMEGPLYHATYDEISMHNHDSGRSSDKFLAEDATGGRMAKSLYYRAPVAGPLKIEVLHAFLTKDPAKDNATNPRHDEFALTYEEGDSWIAGGYAESRNLNVDKAWTLAGSTTVKSIVLAVLFEKSATIPLEGMTAYRNYGRFAAKLPIGKHELHVNFGVAGSLTTRSESGAAQTTVGYNYNLAEQTKVYAFATRIGNKHNASYSFGNNTPNGAAIGSIAIGFRRNF